MNQINWIKKEIAPLREELINHKLFKQIKGIEDLKIFMEHHVFAVWDFMSLLKSLQSSLTCTTVPWHPVSCGEVRYLINEIVTGEESDLDLEGKRLSHFELYLDAMKQISANTNPITTFSIGIKGKQNLKYALENSKAPLSSVKFVENTFSVIETQPVYVQAAVFTFGREDLIPGMFISMVKELDKHNPNMISIFKYYLERHIEVDGDHHSKLAYDMTKRLCDNDEGKWAISLTAIKDALKTRIQLWDSIVENIEKR